MRRLFLLTPLLLTVQLATPLAAQEASDRDPSTMAALDRMGAALRNQSNVALRVDITTEDVLKSGQKVQFGGSVDMLAVRPDKLKVHTKVGQSERQIYYDGKKVTLFAPQPNFYAIFPAPPTIREMLKVAGDQYGLEIPLADMVAWGTDEEMKSRVVEAFPLGKEIIGGQACDHHAIRGLYLDWQVWIREGQEALPCKLVITSRADPAMPQYTAVYSWKTLPTIDAAAFDFKAPEGANLIIFGPMKGSTKAAEKK